jgi:hydrogenase maturation protein HypF
LIKGLVQGVGFRPFIHRLAGKYRLNGEVDNRTNGVLILVEGDESNIKKFIDNIVKDPPVAAQIKSVDVIKKEIAGFERFSIVHSKNEDNQVTEISPDIAVCEECMEDLNSDNERINYPFVNCTNCGPRFTIINGLPYDREKTSMKDFEMCSNCSSEYDDVSDRRFHAQPIACNSCGPVYTYEDPEKQVSEIKEIIGTIAERINNGKSVAVKGIGGYHLMCNALDNDAINDLRCKKHRDSKPFAVMFRDISSVRDYCYLNANEEKEITSWRRPILILEQKKMLSDSVNGGIGTVGALLPYMPFHYMLFRKLKTCAVVLTSGNISDEPIITDDNSALNQLMPVAGSVLSHNRQIVNRTDDSVVRIISGEISLIRRSRGFVPEPVDLCCDVDGIIALGAEQKNSFCIGKEKQAIMSQYIGDLKNLPTYEFFKQSVAGFQKLFLFKPRLIACDQHPDYLSTTFAEMLEEELHIPVIRIQHHHAHIASCMAENHLDEKVIGISLDGTGYGTDGNTWGSEFMIADLKEFVRYTHFDYIPMPGGDKAVDEPWRMALSYLYKYFGDSIDYSSIRGFNKLTDQQLSFVKEMIDKKINSPLTCGAGRLFDTVSALLGLCSVSGFDSEAPIRLESAITEGNEGHYPYEIGETLVFSETLKGVLHDLQAGDILYVPARFHNTVAMAVTDVAMKMRKDTSINKVILSGGVFQNKYLLEKLTRMLSDRNFEVFTNHRVPVNDGGVSLGQLIIASKMIGLCA